MFSQLSQWFARHGISFDILRWSNSEKLGVLALIIAVGAITWAVKDVQVSLYRSQASCESDDDCRDDSNCNSDICSGGECSHFNNDCSCGDGRCENQEDSSNCPADCNSSPPLPPRASTAKLIEWGWDSPQSAENVVSISGSMQTAPFRGTLLQWQHFQVFSKSSYKFMNQNYQSVIDKLKSVSYGKFTEMGMRISASSGQLGAPDVPHWFDDAAWTNTLNNVKIVARIAKAAGYPVIAFDVEDYSDPQYDPTGGMKLWEYPSRPDRGARTFAEFQAKVFQRGQQFIQAIDSEHPNAQIITTWCYSLPAVYGNADVGTRYGLLASFCDGMVQGAAAGTVIHEASENAYLLSWVMPTGSEISFANLRNQLYSTAQSKSSNPSKLASHYKAGFGIWLVPNSVSSGTWQNLVMWALRQSDGYVWVYSERQGGNTGGVVVNWWTGAGLNQAYYTATQAAINAVLPPPSPSPTPSPSPSPSPTPTPTPPPSPTPSPSPSPSPSVAPLSCAPRFQVTRLGQEAFLVASGGATTGSYLWITPGNTLGPSTAGDNVTVRYGTQIPNSRRVTVTKGTQQRHCVVFVVP